MWYQRITEYHDVEPSLPPSKIPSQILHSKTPVFGQNPFSTVIFGPEPPHGSLSSKKRKHENPDDAEIALFKRVRLLSKKTRVRKRKVKLGPLTRLATNKSGFTDLSSGTLLTETPAWKSVTSVPDESANSPPPIENPEDHITLGSLRGLPATDFQYIPIFAPNDFDPASDLAPHDDQTVSPLL